MSDKEIAVALSVGKDNMQIRAVFQVLEDLIESSLSQVAHPQLSIQHGALAHIAGNYGAYKEFKDTLEDRIEGSHHQIMDRPAVAPRGY